MIAQYSFGLQFCGRLVLGGYAGKRTNPVKDGTVELKIVQPEANLRLGNIQIYQYEDELVVYGTIHRGYRFPYGLTRHVDVAVLGPDGKLVQDIQTQARFFPFPNKSPERFIFNVRLPLQAPTGSTVVIASHQDTCDSSEDECLTNLQISESQAKI